MYHANMNVNFTVKCNSNQIWNIHKFSEWESPRTNVCEKGDIWNPVIHVVYNDKYARNIVYNSVITCD